LYWSLFFDNSLSDNIKLNLVIFSSIFLKLLKNIIYINSKLIIIFIFNSLRNIDKNITRFNLILSDNELSKNRLQYKNNELLDYKLDHLNILASGLNKKYDINNYKNRVNNTKHNIFDDKFKSSLHNILDNTLPHYGPISNKTLSK
jgi:hypothetical protein